MRVSLAGRRTWRLTLLIFAAHTVLFRQELNLSRTYHEKLMELLAR
jgi:hypothetical protein